MNYNSVDFIKYLISETYGLNIEEMRNFKLLKDKCMYFKDDSDKCVISLSIIEDIIDKLKNLGSENKSNQRVGFIIESDIIKLFLSTYYIEYRLFCNFIKILNHNNIGVDLITDCNIVSMIPNELISMDINLYFSPRNKSSYSIEKMLENSIQDYYMENPTTIRCISDTVLGTKGLINAKIPKEKKLLLLHAQKLLNFPMNDNINDKEDFIFDFIEIMQDVDFKICATSQVLIDKLKSIIPNKEYYLIEELGYTVKDAEEHFYVQQKYQTKNIIIKYTNNNDLSLCFKAIKPLNYFITVLIDDYKDKKMVDYFMEENDYTNYRVRNKNYYNLLKQNYNVAIDFSENITIPYECKVICNEQIQSDVNYLPTDKNNPILIIKNILMCGQVTYGIIQNDSSFVPKENIDECMCNSLKSCVI